MIETERLRVRSVVETDVDSIFALFSDPRVARWSGDGQAMTSRDEAVARVSGMPRAEEPSHGRGCS